MPKIDDWMKGPVTPMDELHCPLGSLREEARKTAAIGLRIALDNLRLRWSERGQTAYDNAKKAANETLSAWNEHIRTCELCRGATSELLPPRKHSGFVTAPTILIVDDNHASVGTSRWHVGAGLHDRGRAILRSPRYRTSHYSPPRPDHPGYFSRGYKWL